MQHKHKFIHCENVNITILLSGYFLRRSRSGFPHSNFSLESSTSGEMYALCTASSGKEGGRESCRWREEREMEEGETERGERKDGGGGQEAGERRGEGNCMLYFYVRVRSGHVHG